MTIKYQLSDKRMDAILLVTAEHEDADVAYNLFRAGVEDLSLTAALAAFGQPGPTAAAVHAVTQAFPTAAIQPVHPPQLPAAAGGAAPGGAPSCQHGVKQMKTGQNDRGEWRAWACPARSSDPTRCKFQFIRD